MGSRQNRPLLRVHRRLCEEILSLELCVCVCVWTTVMTACLRYDLAITCPIRSSVLNRV
jgi:hypothetical protein